MQFFSKLIPTNLSEVSFGEILILKLNWSFEFVIFDLNWSFEFVILEKNALC